jgi:CHAT domain-containing protein
MASSVLRNLGIVCESLGNRPQSLAYYNQALALQQERKDRWGEARTLIELGRLHAASNRETAVEYLSRGLNLSRDVRNPIGEALALYALAQVERSRDNLVEARSQIEASLSLIESLRAKVASQDLRSSYFATVRQRYEFYVELLMQLHRQRPTEGFDALALQASERARARSLLELLTEARADITAGADSGLLERERSLQQLIRDKGERQMRLSGGRQSAEAAAIARELQELTTSYDEVRSLIRAQSPHYAALVQPQPLTLAEIQRQVLDPDTLLLEYALGDERSYLWAVTPDSMASFELPPRAEIEAAARRVYELITTRQQLRPQETITQRLARISRADAECAQAAAALSRMILEPVATLLGTKRLLIVSDGALQYVPFAALPKPEFGSRKQHREQDKSNEAGRKSSRLQPADFRLPTAECRPLIADHEIISLPSASTLAVLRRELAGRAPAPKAVAVLADPVFEANDDRVRAEARQMLALAGSGETNSSRVTQRQRGSPPRRTARPSAAVGAELERALRSAGVRNHRGSVSRLIFSRREAEAILKTVPAEAAMKAIDFAASQETAVSAELGQYRIIHFATHGLLNTEQPQLSGILLSLVDEQGRAKDGFLQLHEIYNLRLPAELVVLSACQTGLGREVSGEGLVGLTRGFMYAGAARVVASLWKVDDVATAELMKRFYEEMLGKGQTPAAALRAAQVSMWRQQPWQSPAAWAAFVIQGEWK